MSNGIDDIIDYVGRAMGTRPNRQETRPTTTGGSAGGSIVVSAVDAASSVACLRSLGRRGIHTIGVSEREEVPAFHSRYCGEAVVAPSPAEDLLGYKEALLSVASREDVRAICPLREEDVYVLSAYREEFAEHVRPL